MSMGWASAAIEALNRGQSVEIRPRGHSMKGRVNDGDRVMLSPCNPEELSTGDVVLVRVKGKTYLHLIKASDGKRYQIGNNRGGINGWVGRGAIYGVAVKVSRGR
jgi:hypothetical protein